MKMRSQLSKRYATGYLPTKAIHLLDLTCTHVRKKMDSGPDEICELELDTIRLNHECESLGREDPTREEKLSSVNQKKKDLRVLKEGFNNSDKQRADKVAYWKRYIKELMLRHDLAVNEDGGYASDLMDQINVEKLMLEEDVDLSVTATAGREDVAFVLSEMTGIPVKKLGEDESIKLSGLEIWLKERILGQDEVIKVVVDTVIRGRVGLKWDHKPTGSFLFTGPTGVGKTELAKALAEH